MITPESVGLTWENVWALLGVVVGTNLGVFFAKLLETYIAKRMSVDPPWSQRKGGFGELLLSVSPFVIGILASYFLQDDLGRKWMFIGGTLGATSHIVARIGKLIAAKLLQQRLGVVLPPADGGTPPVPEQKKE